MNFLKNLGVAEIAQWFKELAALTEDLGSGPSTCASKSSVTPVPGVSGLCRYQAHIRVRTYVSKILIQKNNGNVKCPRRHSYSVERGDGTSIACRGCGVSRV